MRTVRPSLGSRRRNFTTARATEQSAAGHINARGLLGGEYFLANGFLDLRSQSLDHSSPTRVTRTQKSSDSVDGLAGRTVSRRAPLSSPTVSDQQAALRQDEGSQGVQQSSAAPNPQGTPTADPVIPPDASSRLSSLSSTLPSRSFRRLVTTYLSLSKPRLSFLIVLTTTTAYSLYPVPALLLPSTTASPSLSALTLVFLTTGTALSSASANALNMLFEPSHDAKMSRTRNRPLVRNLISRRGALLFAMASGAAGIGALYYGVNPTVAFLSALNVFLYAGVYTPLKRISVLNTWVGAIVGGIPPLMGWAAAAGQSATTSGDWPELLFGSSSAGGWLLAALLFAWQFPHFNALSWTIREEYKNAGYRMLAWTNPRRNARVALRYAILIFPVCVALTWVGVTDRGFLVTSSVVNAWMVREAWRFWRKEGRKGSARGLFWASVWHLPVVMVLAMAHKKGLWERVWNSVVGEPEEFVVDDEETSTPEELQMQTK